jgi:hypothetical protein
VISFKVKSTKVLNKELLLIFRELPSLELNTEASFDDKQDPSYTDHLLTTSLIAN